MVLQKLNKYYPLFIPLVLWTLFFLIIQTNWYKQDAQLMSMALTIDFLLTVPLLYFLAIRKKPISKFTVFTVFVLGLVLATVALPDENQFYLDNFKFYILPFIELGVFSFVIFKTVKTIKAFKENKSNEDFYSTLLITTQQMFPKAVATLVATEISMFYYGFFIWKKRSLKENEFTYHKKNALISMIGGLTLVIVGETFGLHAWLVKWNVVVGWIITILSAYTAIQFFALAKSILQRPVFIDTENNEIHLKFGFFSDFKLDMSLIESVEINTSDLPEDKSVVPFSPLGKLGEQNVRIHLKKEVQFSGIYGIKRKAKSLAIFIDEKERFVELLKN